MIAIAWVTKILAVWILATKLSNSDVNLALDSWVDFVPGICSKEKWPQKIHPKNLPQISPNICSLSGPVPRNTARLSSAIPRIVRYTVFGVSTWPIGCDTPTPFSERFPLGEHAKWRCDTPPPPQKGYLSDTCAIPHENKENACDTPLCDTNSKGLYAIWGGGISHWAAKPFFEKFNLD